jgi:GrpE
VVDEYHRGYQIGERILRPARVSVSKETATDSNGRSGSENNASDLKEN